jgi:hypothetical protein
MDLPDPRSEANKKLCNTYMVVNGEILYIKEFNYSLDYILYAKDHFTSGTLKVKPKTLSVWLPEVGLYPLRSGQAIFVMKCPKRQWLKSLSTTYYTFRIVGSDLYSIDKATTLYNQIYQSKRVTIFVDSERNIFYLDENIGYVKDKDTLVCTDIRYIQELKDWERDNG